MVTGDFYVCHIFTSEPDLCWWLWPETSGSGGNRWETSPVKASEIRCDLVGPETDGTNYLGSGGSLYLHGGCFGLLCANLEF